MNVLYWIKNPGRKFKSFVAHRIGEIHTATEPTQMNFGSRGMDYIIGLQHMVE